MMVDLIQYVDLTVTEADGIKGFTQTDDDGRHYIELVEDGSPCEVCDSTDTYRLKATTHTVALCKKHLREEPTHIKLAEPGGDQ